MSRTTNIQFSWLKVVPDDFILGCDQDNDYGYNFTTKKKICLVHKKRRLAAIEINRCLS